jgi:hypothetical protein
MKTPNKHLTRLVAAVTTTGVLAPSCTPFVNDSNMISKELPSKGVSAIDLRLTKSEMDYLRFLEKLGNNIIQHPVIAREFAKNPQLFLESYGYHEKIDMEENLLKLILTLGDEDINNAFNSGDIKMTLKIMEEKGLLNELSNSYSAIDLTKEQATDLLALMGIDIEDVECYSGCLFPALCVVLLLAAVAIYIAGATIAALAVGIYFELGWISSMKSNSFIDNNPSLKIWALKGNSKDTYIATDMYLDQQIDGLLNLLDSSKIQNVKKYDRQQMRDFLKLNLLMQKR